MTKFVGDAPDLERMFPNQSYFSGWESPESFAKHIQANQDKSWLAIDRGNEAFYGTATLEEAINMTFKGWPLGADRIMKLRDRILVAYPIRKEPVKYGIAGAIPDVPRAIAGNPMNMKMLADNKTRKRPVITLVSSVAANCGVSSECITNRAAAVAALVDHIESAGYSCEIITAALTSGGTWSGENGFKAVTMVRVKESSQPVDIVRLSFSLGHAAFFRRMMFTDWSIEPSCQSGIGQSLGSAYILTGSEALAEKSVFIIPSVEKHSDKFEKEEDVITKGLPFLISSLREQGCPAFPKHLTAEISNSILSAVPVQKPKKKR